MCLGYRWDSSSGSVLSGIGSCQHPPQNPSGWNPPVWDQTAVPGGGATPLQHPHVPSLLHHQPAQTQTETTWYTSLCVCYRALCLLHRKHRVNKYCVYFFFFAEVGPASVMVGNLVAGKRMAQASGRDLSHMEDNEQVNSEIRSAERLITTRPILWNERLEFNLMNNKCFVLWSEAWHCVHLYVSSSWFSVFSVFVGLSSQ